ncbi:MAG TPA: CHRD domain-containing protein [Candidatus Limnocylindria bacterium]|nr:CHRD domain-containing protein [Candidatus Limnocylindria bacterium]
MLIRLALSIAVVVLAHVPVKADTLEVFTAVLNGAQEVPPVDSPSQGVALVTLNKNTSAVCYALSYSPLAGTETVAHFHGPAAPGQAADVLVGITPSPSPVGSPKNGCVTFDKTGVKNLRKGLVYLNVHTSVAPTGEIRGQVLPAKLKYKNVPPIASPSGAFVEPVAGP